MNLGIFEYFRNHSMFIIFFYLSVVKDALCNLKIDVVKTGLNENNKFYSKENADIEIEFAITSKDGGVFGPPLTNSLINLKVINGSSKNVLGTIDFKSGSPNFVYTKKEKNDSSEILESYENRIEMIYKGNKVFIKLKNLKSSDFNRQYGIGYDYNTFKREAAYVLLVKAVKPSITWANYYPTAYQSKGSKISYKCMATGDPLPSVKWIFDGQVKALGKGEVKMVIENAGIEQTGRYNCSAENPAGDVSQNMDLFVTIIEYDDNSKQSKIVSIPEGGMISEDCKIWGLPKHKLQYTWKNPKGDVIGYGKKFTQTIKKFGLYTCEVTFNDNVDNTAKLNYTLNIQKQVVTTTPSSQGQQGNSARFIESSILFTFIIYLVAILSTGLVS